MADCRSTGLTAVSCALPFQSPTAPTAPCRRRRSSAAPAPDHGPERLYLRSHPKGGPDGFNSTKACCAAIADYLRGNCRTANTVLPSAIAVGGIVMMSDIGRFKHEVFAALSKAGVKLLLLHRRNKLRQLVSELHHRNHGVFGTASEGALAKLRSLKVSTSPDELLRGTRMKLKDQDMMTTMAVTDYTCYPRQLPMGRPCDADAGGQSNESEVAACRGRASKFAARAAVVESSHRYSESAAWPSVHLCALLYYEDLQEKLAEVPISAPLQCSGAGHRGAADPGCPLEALVVFLSGAPAALGSFLQHRDAASRKQPTTKFKQQMLKKVHAGAIWSFLDVDEEETRRKFRGSGAEWMLDD